MASDHLTLPAAVAEAVRAELPSVAERTVAAVVVEVPSYADAFSGDMGRKIENAVRVALGGFLELAAAGGGTDAGTPIGPALEGAYALGRGEARSGRSMDALLAAYRVGARVAWRHLSGTAVAAGLGVDAVARFAELVFAYIDQLSASSAAGHTDELADSGQVRRRRLEHLASLLITGAPVADVSAAAEHAEWAPPQTLTAVLLPQSRARDTLVRLDARTLQVPEDRAPHEASAELTVLLVPDTEGRARPALLRALAGKAAVVGPARPWQQVSVSYTRALRAVRLGLTAEGTAPLDTDARLVELLLRADDEALTDLRAQVLAPLATLSPSTRDKLVETLRAWVLHHGRRERIAAELFVHPQTVRYRMGQLRELYGDRLDDPQTILEITVALGTDDR
ncbi:PucR family transcriptional regulator [Planosporangium mesophilum]|uniref:PucR family transcriptional regulator n=1 Tax=Planosporangium mesophilum TaxID=689768 RepID=A0A8J3TEN7_9ACTN|nr:PucR family transcriptional regulator [Planosporangium mesophilum]NJC84458.1 PucR family transcriptional regulator [Planosporangium mesophilum]GII23399.1 hypothetical protein Pme01_29960 [Planosporangium mesophilum]